MLSPKHLRVKRVLIGEAGVLVGDASVLLSKAGVLLGNQGVVQFLPSQLTLWRRGLLLSQLRQNPSSLLIARVFKPALLGVALVILGVLDRAGLALVAAAALLRLRAERDAVLVAGVVEVVDRFRGQSGRHVERLHHVDLELLVEIALPDFR